MNASYNVIVKCKCLCMKTKPEILSSSLGNRYLFSNSSVFHLISLLPFLLVMHWYNGVVDWRVKGHNYREKCHILSQLWDQWLFMWNESVNTTLGFLSPLHLVLKDSRWVWPFHRWFSCTYMQSSHLGIVTWRSLWHSCVWHQTFAEMIAHLSVA